MTLSLQCIETIEMFGVWMLQTNTGLVDEFIKILSRCVVFTFVCNPCRRGKREHLSHPRHPTHRPIPKYKYMCVILQRSFPQSSELGHCHRHSDLMQSIFCHKKAVINHTDSKHIYMYVWLFVEKVWSSADKNLVSWVIGKAISSEACLPQKILND